VTDPSLKEKKDLRKSAGEIEQYAEQINKAQYAKQIDKTIEQEIVEHTRQAIEAGEISRKELDNRLYNALSVWPRYSEVELLLNFGANPNTLHGKRGESALHRAARDGKSEIVQLLLQKNANPNTLDKDGKSPLYRAQEVDAPSKDLLKVIELLKPVTRKDLQFVAATPKIALKRAVIGSGLYPKD